MNDFVSYECLFSWDAARSDRDRDCCSGHSGKVTISRLQQGKDASKYVYLERQLILLCASLNTDILKLKRIKSKLSQQNFAQLKSWKKMH